MYHLASAAGASVVAGDGVFVVVVVAAAAAVVGLPGSNEGVAALALGAPAVVATLGAAARAVLSILKACWGQERHFVHLHARGAASARQNSPVRATCALLRKDGSEKDESLRECGEACASTEYGTVGADADHHLLPAFAVAATVLDADVPADGVAAAYHHAGAEASRDTQPHSHFAHCPDAYDALQHHPQLRTYWNSLLR